MRIDFVITELFVGGAERCLTELAIGMAHGGDRVRVFSLGKLPDGEQRLLVERLLAAGIPVESGGADSSLRFASAYRQLRAWLDQSPPKLCQTFLFHANVLGTLAARSAGVAVRVAGLRVAEARPLRCAIERAALKRTTSVVCVSAAVESFAAQRLGCEVGKTIVVPNGVDVQRFRAASPLAWSKLGWPDDSIVTLFVGRLHPQKGIDLLQTQIDAIAPASSSRRLLIVGDGPLKDPLDQWCRRIGDDRVRLLPWQVDVAPLIRAARVLVLPSRYEGMPNVALEAMAAARPVVCSRVEGSEELFSHAAEPQTFPVGDAQAMETRIARFLSDEAFSDAVGLANQTRAERDFSIPSMVDAYRSHYRTLLSRRLDVP